jgi:flavin-dependent dehydrogenase
VLDRRDLAGAHVRVVIAEKPTVIVGHAFTTGVIQRQGFEKVLPGPVVEIGIKDGVDCAAFTFPLRQSPTLPRPCKPSKRSTPTT